MKGPRHYTYSVCDAIKEDRRGRNPAYWVTHLSYGKESICSKESPSPYLLPNEWICGHLANILRLPCPPFAVMQNGSEPPMFTNLQFTPNNVSPPDTVAENCWRVDPHTCVGIFLFDLFVLNNDRDRKNLYVDNPARPKEILIYDHDVALSEAMYNEAAIRFKRDKDAFLTYHMLLPVIDSDSRFLHWIKRIQSIPDWFLKDICDEVVSRDFTQTESNACRKFLRHRQDNLLYIVNKHRDRFLKSMKWSLKLT